MVKSVSGGPSSLTSLSSILHSPMVYTLSFILFALWFVIREEGRILDDYRTQLDFLTISGNSELSISESEDLVQERPSKPRQHYNDDASEDLPLLQERPSKRDSQQFNDYGEEDYGEGGDPPMNIEDDPLVNDDDDDDDTPPSTAIDEDSSNKNRLKLYLERDDSVIEPSFRNTKRIVVDASFHFFRDRYGLIDSTFTVSELEDILRDVSRTWMRGNIWIRFKRLPRTGGKLISDKAADALRWWVFGYKDLKENRTRYWQDVKMFLRNGASKMTKDEAEKDVLKRYYEYGGHSLMNWILGVGGNPQKTTIQIDVITVGFWPWYNGGAIRGRVFVRGGSCSRDVYEKAKISKDDNLHPICNGWKIDHEAGVDMTAAEMGRVLSHEFGHIFGLAHPAKGACQYADKKEELVLMAQQRSVAIKGTECSVTNPDAKFSRYVRANEMTRARTVALWISQQQRKLAQANVDAEVTMEERDS